MLNESAVLRQVWWCAHFGESGGSASLAYWSIQ